MEENISDMNQQLHRKNGWVDPRDIYNSYTTKLYAKAMTFTIIE